MSRTQWIAFLLTLAAPTTASAADTHAKRKPATLAEKQPPATKTVEIDDADDTLEDSGFALGVKAGYALPMGSVAKDAILQGANDLSKYASGALSFGVDLGYRITPKFYAGATFGLAIISTSGDICNRVAGTAPGCSSSGTNLRFGIAARYTFRPDAKLGPWIGIGSGYEVMNLSTTVQNASADSTLKGWEFVNLQLGADYRFATHAAIGPMIGFSLAQYGSYSGSRPGASVSGDLNNTSLHQWVFLGVQGHYDL
jgi:opacity protein-like surface antigen